MFIPKDCSPSDLRASAHFGNGRSKSSMCTIVKPVISAPFRFGIRPDSFRDAVDVVEVCDHLDRIVDRGVIPAVRPKVVRVCGANRRWVTGELDGVVAERPHRRRQLGAPIVVRGVRRQLFVCALGTEVVCMSAYSVVAFVLAGDDGGE